ncbi:MAG: hypothetical protein HRU19_02170 [Pseudobacteriovorax sp.]|nr:hypothetical protein [Pseudobacteriovorax sp.]
MNLLFMVGLLLIVSLGCKKVKTTSETFSGDAAVAEDSQQSADIIIGPSEPEVIIEAGDVQEALLAFASCNEVKEKSPTAKNGVYQLYVGQGDEQILYQAHCDLETEGGGWTLVLNYVHEGGTNPDLVVMSDKFPLMGPGLLGTSEAGTEFFGHASAQLVQAIPATEVRMYCETSGNPRIIHFSTSETACLQYFKTGTGSCRDIANSFQPLSKHTGNLPEDQDALADENQGDFAMTSSTMRSELGNNHWSINGNGDWECDDDPDNSQNSTIHRIWIR